MARRGRGQVRNFKIFTSANGHVGALLNKVLQNQSAARANQSPRSCGQASSFVLANPALPHDSITAHQYDAPVIGIASPNLL